MKKALILLVMALVVGIISTQTYADIVSSHCNLSSEEIIDMMQEDTWFTANQAKEWGMVDEII